MKIYDVLVIGNDISAYYASSLLSQKGYQVAHVLPDQPQIKETLIKSETSHLEPMFLGRLGMSQKYLVQAGLESFLQKENIPSKEVLSDGRLLTRKKDKAALKRYLLRHFPQEHLAINQFFKDLHQEYQMWLEHYERFFNDEERQVCSWLEKYQTETLKELLDRYFKSPDLKDSVQMMMNFHGYQLTQIPAIEFILEWFWMIEESAVPFNLDLDALIKHFKKQSPDVDYLKSAMVKSTFKTDHYVVTLKNKETLQSRFLIGQTTRHDDDEVIYRIIDIELDQGYYQKTFIQEVVFKATPLFESLRVIPLNLYHPKVKNHLRIETISEANKDLILTFIDRYFKHFESHIVKSIEYPPVRKRMRDLEDVLSETLNPESDLALFSEPKWIQVDLNHQPKVLIARRLFKTQFYVRRLIEALEIETTPPPYSPIYQTFKQWVLRYENPKPEALFFKLGFQQLFIFNDQDGAMIDSDNQGEFIEMSTAEFMNLSESLKDETIDQTALKPAIKKVFKEAFSREKPPLNVPLGFLQLQAVLLFLISLVLFPLSSALTFSAAAFLVVLMMVRWIVFKEWTLFEAIFSALLLVVSFIQISQTLNVGFLLVVLAILGWILQSLPFGLFSDFFGHDPLRLQYSTKYIKHFSQRMTRYFASALLILGIAALATSTVASVIAGVVALGVSLTGYFLPVKPVVRKI